MKLSDVPEPKYEAQRPYAVTGKILNGILRAIRKRTLMPGRGIKFEETVDGGTQVHATGALGSGLSLGGNFSTLYEQDGDTFLMGGNLGAGEGSESLDDYMVLDAAALPTGVVSGDRLWIELTLSAILDDDNEAIIAGVELTAAAYGYGATPPANVFPGLSTSGTLVLEIGRWNDTEFLPGAGGNFVIAACPGNYNVTRV